jgi:predicted ribosomally synthesized peptide with SipW-like signal peptide
MAILAAGLVLGIGATVTLAVWNDSEWVTGGADLNGDGVVDTPGVGTSVFEVQQNTSSPYSDTAWSDRETEPGGPLDFTIDALNLTPGEAVYAPVSLTTTATSVAAESLALNAAIPSPTVAGQDDVDGLLFSALQLRVVVAATADAAAPATCSAAAFTGASTYVIGSALAPAALNAAGPAVPTVTDLAAAGADKLDYCFEISLPEGAPSTLQGRDIAPTWQFIADSVA